MTKPLKIGVIGTGKMGRYHLGKLLEIPEAEVIGAYDISAEQARDASLKFPVKLFENLEQLLFEVDAVIVATSTSAHYSVSKKALEQGVHVLVEKPMASTLEQGRELVGLAERNGLALQVGFVERFRFQSLFQQHFFEADYIEAKRRMPLSLAAEHADLVSDLMIHDIDLVLHAFHQEAPVEIDPVAYGYGPHGYPRLVACRLRFSKNRTADLLASRLHSENERSIRLCDALNSVRIDLSASRVNHWTFSEGTRNPTGETVREAIKLDPLLLQAKSFVQAARGEEKLTVSGAEGVLALQVAEEIKKRLHALASYPFDSDVSWSRVE